jgi:hypothetical protein
MSAFIDDANTDFSDAWILNELTDQLCQLYERAIVNARSGFWLKNEVRAVTQGTSIYRVPLRAVVGGMNRVEISYDGQQSWCLLDEVDEAQAMNYELGGGQQGQPVRFVLRGDEITLLPTPNNSTYAIRIFYYLKPSRLVAPQASLTAGLVSNVNNTTKVITTSAAASSIDAAGASTAMTVGSWTVDVVSGTSGSFGITDLVNSGWHEVSANTLVATVTGSGVTFTCPAGADLSHVQVGDYVRASGQTEWPCLPADFHRTLCDAAAVKILKMRSFDQKAAVLEDALNQDLSRFADLLKPRVQSSAKVIVAPRLYRGQRRNWLVKYP